MCSRLSFAVLLCAFWILSSSTALAQNELSVSAGGAFTNVTRDVFGVFCPAQGCPPGTGLGGGLGNGVYVEGDFVHRIANLGGASFALEFPLASAPSRRIGLTDTNMSSLFFTPSLLVRLAPRSRVTPFGSIGAGLAHFGGAGTSNNTGALQLGGGAEIRTGIPFLGFRAEVRDFLSGSAEPLGGTTSRHLNNIFAGGGVVFHF